jgi:hypothetical protein
MKANPGGYIPPSEVVGRDALIQRLWDILGRQSLILTAERRIGKTSILRKMEAEPPPGKLPIFHELENLNTPSEFVQTVVNDVKAHLSRSKRIGRQVTEFFNRFGGGTVGNFKLPNNVDLDWKPLLTQTIEHLVTHQEDTLVFLWDEMPMMLDNIKRNDGEAVAMDVLNTLRLLRQMYPDLRMVYTGSIGLHHVLTSLKQTGYINAPTNDMHTVDVPPLSDTDASDLARQLLDGENIQPNEPEQTAQTIAGAVDNHPFYIHHIVDAFSLDETSSINEIVVNSSPMETTPGICGIIVTGLIIIILTPDTSSCICWTSWQPQKCPSPLMTCSIGSSLR